jgi:hypothetical protein
MKRRKWMTEAAAVEVELKDAVEQELSLEAKLRAQFEVDYQKRLEAQIVEISKQMTAENQKIVQEAIERFRKEMLPPNEQDIKKLVDQEYMEVTFEIPSGRKGKEKKTFVIRELPQSVERRMFKKVRERLVPFATEMAGLSMNLMDGDVAKKLVQVMNTFEPALDVMVSICTLCLNPFGEDEEVDEKWVADHVSSTRILKIVTAQFQCNKLRDFFSLLFQGSKLVL